MAALASGDLLRSHMALNRKKDDVGHGAKRSYSTHAAIDTYDCPDYDEQFAPSFPIP